MEKKNLYEFQNEMPSVDTLNKVIAQARSQQFPLDTQGSRRFGRLVQICVWLSKSIPVCLYQQFDYKQCLVKAKDKNGDH